MLQGQCRIKLSNRSEIALRFLLGARLRSIDGFNPLPKRNALERGNWRALVPTSTIAG